MKEVVLVLVTRSSIRPVRRGVQPSAQGLVTTSSMFCWPWTESPLKVMATVMPAPWMRLKAVTVTATSLTTWLGRPSRPFFTLVPRSTRPTHAVPSHWSPATAAVAVARARGTVV